MKTNTKIIIYDNSCPLCAAYTNAFIKTGLIDKDGRKDFSTIDPALLNRIDQKRCSNEIPVIDTSTSQVWYGIDALLEILHQKYPFIKKIGSKAPVKWMLEKVYKLISYNRRVIVAAASKPGNFDCTPDFNSTYRLLFMLIFLAFNTAMLQPLYYYVFPDSFISSSTIVQLQGAHFGLVAINITIAWALHKKEGLEYLGQVNMLAFIAILLLIPLLLLNRYGVVTGENFNNSYLGLITLFMVKEYYRRMKFAGIIQQHLPVVYINTGSIVAFIVYLVF